MRARLATYALMVAMVVIVAGPASASGVQPPAEAAAPAPQWIEAGPSGDPQALVYADVGIAADFGTNHDIRIWRQRYGGSTYGVWAENVAGGFVGHFDFRGPGLDVSSPNQKWYWLEETRQYYGYGSGTVCVEGWAESYLGAGDWRSIGLPCLPT